MKVKAQIGYSSFGKKVKSPFICSDVYDDIEITIPDKFEVYETIGGEYMITINKITLPLNEVLKLRGSDNTILLIMPKFVPDGVGSEKEIVDYWANKKSFMALKYEILD